MDKPKVLGLEGLLKDCFLASAIEVKGSKHEYTYLCIEGITCNKYYKVDEIKEHVKENHKRVYKRYFKDD